MATTIESPFTRALLAGAVAGTSVDLSLYPIDTLKTRLQSSQGFQAAGGFRGIYAGVGSAALGAAPGAALFFVTYEACKVWCGARRELSVRDSALKNDRLGPIEHMIAASAGEVAACAVRVPTEVVKQRAQAAHYRSSLAALQAILSQRKTLGVLGLWKELYRGWNITILREVPFTVIQFPLWEAMKKRRRRTTGKEQVSALESGCFGSVAGAVAAAITTPLDVLKTRMMLSTEKQSTLALFTQISRDSGPSAFFAGIAPRVMWISLGGAIFLGSYEFTINTLRSV